MTYSNAFLGIDFDVSKVTLESLMGYYTFESCNAPYDSLEFWQQIIAINYKLDKGMSILYDSFNKCYPSMHGYAPIIDYIYLPVAVLLSNESTKEKITDYIMDHAGEYGFYNVIRAYSVIGKTGEARDCIEFLFKYINMLTAPVSLLKKY